MPSPFPGMDPFIERQRWRSFHSRFITHIAETIMPSVRPRYIVDTEFEVYLEHEPEESPRPRPLIPDVYVAGTGTPGPSAGGLATAVAPVEIALPMPVEEERAFVTIRDRANLELVAVIEVLSPTNKRTHGDGRLEYVRKRESVLRSSAHLIELDLLRGGERLPTNDPLPPGDYYAIVSRERRRPVAQVWGWGLREPLPTIPIPLAGSDPDVPLDLQAVFTSVYDRAGYDYSLDYRAPVEPPLSPEDAAWVQEVLSSLPEPTPGPASEG